MKRIKDKESLMSLYELFEDDHQKYLKGVQPALAARKQFITEYPIDRIKSLTLDEYLFAKKGFGNERSYCRRVRYDFEWISSFGNVWPDIFGIYLRNGEKIALSKTFAQKYGDDYQTAFINIKEEMVRLLSAIKDNHFEALENCILNSAFKYKLVVLYYLEKVIPVTTIGLLNEYCNHIGLPYNPKEEPIYRNLALKSWANNNPITKDWTTCEIMSFADWLWRKNIYLSNE